MAATIVLGGCSSGASDLVEDDPEPSEPTESTEPTEPSPSPSPTPTGPARLSWYAVGDSSQPRTTVRVAEECTKASGGRYRIDVNEMPQDITTQRAQLQTMLAAGRDVDLVSADQTLLGDFVAAGHIGPLPAGDQTQLRNTLLDGVVAANTVNGRVVAFPLSVNTQLLWFRKSAAKRAGLKMGRPVTWNQLIKAAASTKTTVQVQAKRYEGYVVWLNALIAGAGGRLLQPDSKAGRSAAQTIRQLATSRAADKGLNSATEVETHQRFFNGNAGFMTNWLYVWSLRQEASWKPNDLSWAAYPRTVKGRPARPPIGGVSLAVPTTSKHRQLALAAARCLTSRKHQIDYMLDQGVLSGRGDAYNDPRVRKAFPMADLVRDSLRSAAPRPVVANYDAVSQALQNTFHPPGRVDPRSTPRAAQRAVDKSR